VPFRKDELVSRGKGRGLLMLEKKKKRNEGEIPHVGIGQKKNGGAARLR